jgi:AcrR family transcriptional regulator
LNGSSALSPRPAIDHIRKPQILRAAAEVITERGLVSTRIADVAERAGTSTSAVLYWFESREQLLTEALTADEGSWGAALEARLSQLPTAAAKLREIIDESSRDGDLSLWLELWARSLHDERSRDERQRLDDRWRERIAAVVGEGQESGEFASAIPARDFAVRLASLMDGLSVQVTLGDPEMPADRMFEVCVEFAEHLLEAEIGSKQPELGVAR